MSSNDPIYQMCFWFGVTYIVSILLFLLITALDREFTVLVETGIIEELNMSSDFGMLILTFFPVINTLATLIYLQRQVIFWILVVRGYTLVFWIKFKYYFKNKHHDSKTTKK